MAKRTRFAEYKDRYANFRFELGEEGILFMQCHTKGGSLVWDWTAPRPGVGAGPRAGQAPSPRAPLHAPAVHPGPEARALDELAHGLARETHAQRQFFPVGGEMTPLDRPWDEEPWSD